MKKSSITPVLREKTLTQQKSDFTAEGSPPPEMVSASTPAIAPAAVRGSRKEPDHPVKTTPKRKPAAGKS